MAPPRESHSILKVTTLKETIDQWQHPNPPGLPVALKDWEHGWYSGVNQVNHGVKYGQCKRIAMEFIRYINLHFPSLFIQLTPLQTWGGRLLEEI